MFANPWTLLGALLCALLMIAILVVPIVATMMLRARRRAIRAHAELREQIDTNIREIAQGGRARILSTSSALSTGSRDAVAMAMRTSTLEARVQTAEGRIEAINARIDSGAAEG